ncbi:Hsp20/alpha crystallin family protein [Clostridium thermosuccinogenes]|uniref:Hsp20/alpha crystallin family protein n=1 Tax=Clostridium thermosuccinogenes TaxID=84032 RepID=UPI000CCC4ADE|nr:Hsp20/alpha crystallin family protein [Pseudoclostridium thermosuccinogenes]PNT91110.1 heat-shock protein Hsp20 [Pseudoclostridium thermosuccinogenes]
MFGLTPFNSRRNGMVRRNDPWGIRDFMDSFFSEPFFLESTGIRADIRETDKEYIVDAEIPGVNKENIKLELRDDVLTISVERNEQINEERENYIRRERRYGSYSRSFYVENVKNEDVKAKYANGVLTITLPKQEGGKDNRRRIEIQ